MACPCPVAALAASSVGARLIAPVMGVALLRRAVGVRGAVSPGVTSPGVVVSALASPAIVVAALASAMRGAVVVPLLEAVDAVVRLEAVDAVVRRRVTGLVSCVGARFIAPAAGVLSDFDRVLLRLRGVAVLACSLPSGAGDSDVFFMKKTPFYCIMRNKWCRKSLFTATRKDCRLLHKRKRRQSLVRAVPGSLCSLRPLA